MVRSDERGLSLIEVMLALGLLAGVLISIAGLFAMSEKQVRSGKTSSQALAVCRGVVEDMNSWGFHQTWSNFGIAGATTRAATIDMRANAAAADWQQAVEKALGDGAWGTIEVASIGRVTPAPYLALTRAIRVTVTVHWSEQGRARTAKVADVRM